MTVLPAHVARTSNLLSSQLSLGNISKTNVRLLDLQTQMATGRAVNRPSDSPIKAAAIAALNRRLADTDQRALNLRHATTVVDTLDNALGEGRELVDRATSIASSQIGLGSDAATRAGQATVIDSLIQSLFNLANRDTAGVYFFAGSTPGAPPVRQEGGGFRYVARGSGLLTDLGLGDAVPITLGGNNAIGETSARLRSTLDLNPNLATGNKLTDLAGARGVGVAPGPLTFRFNAGPVATVDLSDPNLTVGGVITRLTAAIRQYETDNGVTVLGPGGITTSGESLAFDIPAGGTLTFSDPTGSTTATDLGLSQTPFTSVAPAGAGLDPRLTLETTLASIPSLTLPLDSIRIRVANAATSQFRDVDLSSAATIDDVRNLIEGANLGVRVQVNTAGTGLDLLNEVAGRRLSIEEVGGAGVNTATLLGIRTLSASTTLAEFNGGRGVGIVDGQVDPVSGTIDPARNVDFRITLGNGQAFDVDLRPQDLASVQTLLARINAEFTTAIGQPPVNASAPALAAGDFTAGLTNAGNGIALTQAVGPGSVSVAARNNSSAAADLGLLSGTYDGATSTLLGQDRAGIRVDNIFSDLIDLRDALLANDSPGITIAAERLSASGDRLTQAHALVGSRAQRIQEASDRLEDVRLIDAKTKSELQDLDFTDAAVRYSLLETQLQAALQTAGRFQNQSLLDFLR